MASIQKFTEERLPYLLTIPVAVVSWQHPIPVPEIYLADFIGSSLTICVVFLGFMATSMSILVSYRTTGLAKELREAKVMERLVGYLREAISWTILWLLVSFLLYFLQPHWLLAAWAVLATLALTCYLRVVALLSKLILK
jgi:hypothetical protein